VTRQLVMEGGLSGWPTKCKYCRYPAPKDVAMATTFWLSVGYSFGCMIPSDTMFDSRGGFSGSRYPIAELKCLRVVDMATNFGIIIVINWLCVNDSN